MPISRDEVIAIYRYVLGREPESEAVIEAQCNRFDKVHDFRIAAIQSMEFSYIIRDLGVGFSVVDREKWVKTDIRNGLSIWVDLHDKHVSWGCFNDNWEEPTVRFILNRIAEGEIFIDIGANVGWFTLLVAQKMRQLGSGHVVAFEPRQNLYEATARSIAENGLDSFVTLHKLALADRTGEMELIWAHGDTGASFLATRGVLPHEKHETVRLARLDDFSFIDPVRIIKSDAEGAEGLIFLSAENVLATHRPVIVSELNFQRLPYVSGITAGELINWLSDHHYTCHTLNEEGELGETIKATSDTSSPATKVVFLPHS